MSLRDKPTRKSTISNLDRVRGCVADEFSFEPTDSAIWTSLRSRDIPRVTRNFLWKCMHDISCRMFGKCSPCQVPESLEHIMLDCNAHGQRQVWKLTERLWRLRYSHWPKLNWGLLLGCGLPRFTSPKGKLIPAQNRFFTIAISTSMYLIWNLRNERIFDTKEPASEREIHNRWVSLINSALKRDILRTNRARFGSLAIKKHLVLTLGAGTRLDEDSLPDDWRKSKGVLFYQRMRLECFAD
ncbi:hypothetical protein FB451DRAFT_1345215 [Mycena latifolia]|nr:hypothetical protein FB451DRAFT_1345215 [Mycena latifolia]